MSPTTIPADGPGWRSAKLTVVAAEKILILTFYFTFEGTLFHRFLFSSPQRFPTDITMKGRSNDTPLEEGSDKTKTQSIHDVQSIYEGSTNTASFHAVGFPEAEFSPKAKVMDVLSPTPHLLLNLLQTTVLPTRFSEHHHREHRAIPSFATLPPQSRNHLPFGCTSRITNSTIYEILSAPPYNLTDSQTGLA